jgi:hypothetical protein
MNRLLGAAVVLLAVGPGAGTAYIKVPPRAPHVVKQVAEADLIVIGTVKATEDRPVKAEHSPSYPKEWDYQSCVVKVEHRVKGDVGDQTEIKVGIPLRSAVSVLTKGQEVCLFLRPHHNKAFYVPASQFERETERKAGGVQFDVIVKGQGDGTHKIEEIRRVARYLGDPVASLKARDMNERLRAAQTLLVYYRELYAPPIVDPKAPQEEIPAEESRLILETIAAGEWAEWYPADGKPRKGSPRRYEVSATTLFVMLKLNSGDRWESPRDARAYNAAAQKWLQENARTYRIKRYLPPRLPRKQSE